MKKLLIAVVMLFSIHSSIQAEETEAHLTKMSIKDINGVTYEVQGTQEGMIFKGLEGRVIFLEFFGHKCPPCLASIPHLIELQKKYKDKVTIVAVEVQNQTEKELQEFVKENNINYIAIAGENANEFIDYIAQRAEWRGSIPFTIGMDTKGDVKMIEIGMVPSSLLEEHIETSYKEVKTEAKIETKEKTETKEEKKTEAKTK